MTKELSKQICEKLNLANIDFTQSDNFNQLCSIPVGTTNTLGSLLCTSCNVETKEDFLNAFNEYILYDVPTTLRLVDKEQQKEIIEMMKNMEWKYE